MSDIQVNWTDEATEQAKKLVAANSDPALNCLRLFISGKNCSGFEYGICFDKIGEDDSLCEFEGFNMAIDSKTAMFVKSTYIEWADDERGRGFLVTNRDERFYRGKFFKKQRWQKHLTS